MIGHFFSAFSLYSYSFAPFFSRFPPFFSFCFIWSSYNLYKKKVCQYTEQSEVDCYFIAFPNIPFFLFFVCFAPTNIACIIYLYVLYVQKKIEHNEYHEEKREFLFKIKIFSSFSNRKRTKHQRFYFFQFCSNPYSHSFARIAHNCSHTTHSDP